MKIGILGTGDVGSALGKGFVTLGHDVKMGSRSANNEKALAWAKQMGPKASAGTFARPLHSVRSWSWPRSAWPAKARFATPG